MDSSSNGSFAEKQVVVGKLLHRFVTFIFYANILMLKSNSNLCLFVVWQEFRWFLISLEVGSGRVYQHRKVPGKS